MPYERTSRLVREALCDIFAQLDSWFDRAEELRRFRPASGGWSVEQVLEQMRTKLADEVPASLNDAVESLVTGAFIELSDMTTQSHENLNNAIEQILEAS